MTELKSISEIAKEVGKFPFKVEAKTGEIFRCIALSENGFDALGSLKDGQGEVYDASRKVWTLLSPKPHTKVFIFMQGENGEGGTVKGVFSNYKDAKNAVLEHLESFSDTWIKVNTTSISEQYWTNGCDVITIEKHVVKGS